MEEQTPKKSKALIITIISVIVLVIAAYFIFRNGDQILGTKNSTKITNNFSPLLGTSKKNTVDVKPTETQTPEATTPYVTPANTNQNTNTSGNQNAPQATTPTPRVITPTLNPLPTPATTGCTDFRGNTIPCTETNPTVTPTQTQTPIAQTDPNICPADDQLVFTSVEKATLEDLTRQYYLIASRIKTEDDLALLEATTSQNESLISQVDGLTRECQAEKIDPNYNGPDQIKSNPYYQDGVTNGNTLEYITGYGIYERVLNIW